MVKKTILSTFCALLALCTTACGTGGGVTSSDESSSQSADSSSSIQSEDSSGEDSSTDSSGEIVVDENGQIVEMDYHVAVSNASTIGVTLQNVAGSFDLGYGVAQGGDWYRVENDYALLEGIYIKGQKASTVEGIFMACMDQKDSLFIGSDVAGGLNMQVGDTIVFPCGLTYENSNGVLFETSYTFKYVWNGTGYTVGRFAENAPDVPSVVMLEDYKSVNKNRLFGIAEPLLEKREGSDEFQVVGFDTAITLGYLQMLNVKSFRLMLPGSIFTKYMMFGPDDFEVELNQGMVTYFKGLISDLREHGVENIILQTNIYPKPTGFAGGALAPTVPSREDDVYGDWCLLLEEQWRVIAETFYEINYFEVGNETNQHAYLSHPLYHFSEEEIIAINTDLLYYANRGLVRGNPYAYCVTPGYTSLGTMAESANSMDTGASINETLEGIYKNIRSGNFPYGDQKSTNIEDYFKVIGLHTYEYNYWNDFQTNMQATVNMINSYDSGRKIFITEMGWPDHNNTSYIETYPDKFVRAYEILYAMPQVEAMCYFRLYNCEYASTWGGEGEMTFGLFAEPDQASSTGFVAKDTAKALQAHFGGVGNLDLYADLATLERELGYTLF